ncbi:alanine--tRNA ligase, partial [Candidatus Falkowbacteria bacterium]|nr:alanine--tRNA ligase [Candidatus Falkowbacteria bacterium]
AVTVFAGDEDAPFDEESYNIWVSLGVAPERIAKLPKKDNWWGPAGTTGPCGPDTEMFYWKGEGNPPEKFDPEDSTKSSTEKWVEIWNDVFMQYNKTAEGKYEPLAQKNIDTGMGLERTIGVLNGCKSVYETELFQPLLQIIEKQSGKKYEGNERAFRIIVDHMRAAVFILGDPAGIVPSNVGQGYVLRRLIRRAIIYADKLGIKIGETALITPFVHAIINIYQNVYHEFKYPDIALNIYSRLGNEHAKFAQTIEKGKKEFEKLEKITGKDALNLFTTYGFPLELTVELARDKGMQVDIKEFEEEFKKHQELSRTASAGQFKGGLADAGAETTRLHTAAHLMLAALRKVLGDHVVQKGSNITAERLRFDFSHPQKVTPEEIKKVEDLVNNEISKKTPVEMREMTVDEAKAAGATGVFEYKYGDKVKVYTIGDPRSGRGQAFSKEICGGPHVDNIGELGHFKIIKEEASSAGIRRIKAVLEY